MGQCSAPRLLRPLWSLLALAALPTALGSSHCGLVAMVLRHENWPIALEPPFQSNIYEYHANLDFTMDTFFMDVRPQTGCIVKGVPASPVPVQIGGSGKSITIYAEHPDTGAKQPYTILTSRLLGSETGLKFLSVVGMEDFQPPFDPTIRDYTVTISIGHDIARISFMLQDNEQRIRSSAKQQSPTGSEEDEVVTPAPEDDGSDESSDDRRLLGTNASWGHSVADPRRLKGKKAKAKEEESEGKPPAETGEVQFLYDSVDFMLDVGYTRVVTLTVQCADATQASIGTYTLTITRPNCVPERPYFSTEKSTCVNFCPAGSYRNEDTHRCSRCNENCKVCQDLLTCQMCKRDTADFNYVIQPDGKCKAMPSHLFVKYRWWCIGLGILNGLLLVIGCSGICQYLWSLGHDVKRKVNFDEDSSSEEDAPLAGPNRGRRLGQY